MAEWEDFLRDAADGTGHSNGNRLVHHPHDDATLGAIWKAIEEASEYIWMSMYILKPDPVGLGTLDRLEGAAHRGCDVRIVYDGIGSIQLREKHLRGLREAGGRAVSFHPVWPPWKKRGCVGLRDHRKLILIDNRLAFCGGMNLAEEYVEGSDDHRVFDDTTVRITGPCLRDLTDVWCRTWSEVADESLDVPPRPDAVEDGVPVRVLETDPRRPETEVISVLGGAISRARDRVRITTPYFIPARWLIDALEEALQNGVDVQILTAGRTDSRVARYAGRHCYRTLLKKGARIFEMQSLMIHTKKLAIDQEFCAVGSYNFDIWTSRHDLDISVATIDSKLAESFVREFDEDLKYSREVNFDAWRDRSAVHRFATWGAHYICRIA